MKSINTITVAGMVALTLALSLATITFASEADMHAITSGVAGHVEELDDDDADINRGPGNAEDMAVMAAAEPADEKKIEIRVEKVLADGEKEVEIKIEKALSEKKVEIKIEKEVDQEDAEMHEDA